MNGSLSLGRSVQDLVRPAIHRPGAAVPGPLAQPAGGPAQREEDAAVLPGVPAHRSSARLLGHRPAQDQDGCLPAQVEITQPCPRCFFYAQRLSVILVQRS